MLSCSAQRQATQTVIQTVVTLWETIRKLRLFKVEYESFPSEHVQHCCMLRCSAQGKAIQTVPTLIDRILR